MQLAQPNQYDYYHETKKVAILGCSGSIGKQTLDVIAALPQNFAAFALAAGSNTVELNRQIRHFQPELVSIGKGKPSDITGIEQTRILQGEEGLIELATHPDVDVVVVATSGAVGLTATLSAIQAKKEVAIANKETLVVGGELVTAAAKKYGVQIRPIDSEHSALWQCLVGEEHDSIEKLLLTASGGPFRTWSLKKLKQATPEQALQHPNWKMGRKITIDSATLMNKGLEVIEAHWLFDQPYDKISVLVHPQSVIHSMVEFVDGSIKAQLGSPNMRHAIQYALTYPGRVSIDFAKLDWGETRSLTFEEPDRQRFPCLDLAYMAGKLGKTYPAALVAADEVLVDLFIEGKISFLDIPVFLEQVLEFHSSSEVTLDSVHETMCWASEKTRTLAKIKAT